MNHTADQWQNNKDPGEKKRRGTFQRLMARPFLVLCWITAGIAFILLGIFFFYPHRNTQMSLLSDLKAGSKVFRTKIPEDILIAQNFFRGKIPVVNQPVPPPTKIDSLPPVEKKIVLAQTFVAPPKQKEPNQETELAQPLEIQTKIETTPPQAKAVPIQSADLLSQKSELQQEIDPYPPAEPQTKIETILPAEEPSVSSQPIFAPSDQMELPEKVDLRLVEIHPQPVKNDFIEKTRERILHSEKWLLTQGPSYYTIQLMGVRKKALLFNFVERNQLLEQNDIAFYQTTYKDKPWFQLLYGVYVTKKDAQAAADNLPLKISKSSPWVRRLSAVQKSIRAQTPP